ncbi:MAG: type II secretion system protein [Phycisphaeraceae bacterium]|nr:type II secretion system protein [Phycisphaerales bacterium]MCB9859413.1 type II secretion system protein [Phycisphaeraceae bacterium]
MIISQQSRNRFSPSQTLSWLLRSVCPLVFVVAGAAKLIALDEFVASLDNWVIIPEGFAGYVAPGIALFEFCIGGAWFLCGCSKRVELFCLGLLAVFIGAYSFESWYNVPPDCNCLGRLSQWVYHDAMLNKVIPRNIVLILVLVVGMGLQWWLAKRKYGDLGGICVSPAQSGEETSDRSSRRATHGFTLIETIVTIAVIGLVISIVVPSLKQFRKQAYRTAAISATKQHTTIFLAYANDFSNQFPFMLNVAPNSNPPIQVNTTPPASWPVESHFVQSYMWNVLLADSYYDGRFIGDDFSLYSNSDNDFWPELYYSCSLLASPEFWNPQTRTGPKQWRSVRTTEVRYPSKKAILFDDYVDDTVTYTQSSRLLAGRERPICMGLVDGSARYVAPDQFGQGYYGFGVWPGYPFLHTPGSSLPAQCTLDGARGRDIVD